MAKSLDFRSSLIELKLAFNFLYSVSLFICVSVVSYVSEVGSLLSVFKSDSFEAPASV